MSVPLPASSREPAVATSSLPPPAPPRPLLPMVVQVVLLVAVLLFLWWLFGAANAALEARGVRTGFDFLSQPAGFAISESWLPYDDTMSFARALAAGVANTIRAALPAAALAVALGILLGIGRLTSHVLVRGVCGVYISLYRNIPLLVHMLLLYFIFTHLLPASNQALPLPFGAMLSKEGLSVPWWIDGAWSWPEQGRFRVTGGAALSPEYLTVTLGLALYTAAFVAEIVRGGLQSVGAGQRQAAQALGLAPAQQMRFVILPQALRAIIPALSNQLLSLVKNSSLAVAVGYPDLVSVANTAMNSKGRQFECIAIIMVVYLSLSLLIAFGMNVYNRRVALRGTEQK